MKKGWAELGKDAHYLPICLNPGGKGTLKEREREGEGGRGRRERGEREERREERVERKKSEFTWLP